MNLKMNLKINRDSVTTTNNTTTTTEKTSTNSKFAALLEDDEEDNNNNMEPHATTSTTTLINNNWASIAKAKPTPKTKTTPTTVQPVDNYQYHCFAEDYSRSPNLGAWLSEPDEQQEEEQQQEEQLTVGDKYGDRLYDILYDYFKNEFHRERTGKVVGMLLECSEEELAEFMTNRLYLEERADEAWALLREEDPPAKGHLYFTEVEDW
jgi:hypothetical protein